MKRPRRLSGIRATGRLHIGNYLGALKQWVEGQFDADNYFFIADLHGLTKIHKGHDPAGFRAARLHTAATILGAGIDPDQATLFIQSAIPQHTELMWYTLALARKSELERMTQWKEARKEEKGQSASAALFAYPSLMAADILLYDADEVPVGADQKQHVEAARDWSMRFNSYFGPTFVVPEPIIPPSAARVKDLAFPEKKMSKSSRGDDGVIYLDDTNDEIVRKFKKAQTDSAGVIAFDEQRPGIANLVQMFATLRGVAPEDVAPMWEGQGYGAFKADLAETAIEAITPIRDRTASLLADPAELERLLGLGTDRATEVAEATCNRASEAIGLGRLL